MLCVLCNVMIQKPGIGGTTVESFFNAVAILREEDQALHRQGHLVRIEKGMPDWGSRPSAPVFVIPKSDVKCSFIMNCKEGNKRDPNP